MATRRVVRRRALHPDIFQVALAKLGHPDTASVVMIGDIPYDAEAAREAHLRSTGLLCGGWPAQDLFRADCLIF